jgi:O-antigen/teichoic acid export membrane protein
MLRQKILKDTVLLNIATIVGQVLSILQGLIVMRFLDPTVYGVWLGLTILLTYSTYANLGLEYGLGIRLPYYQGQKNVEREAQLADTAYVAWTGVALLFAGGVLGYALLAPQPWGIVRWGLVIIVGLTVLEQQIGFLGRWQTTSLKDFSLPSRLFILRGVASFLLVVPLAYFFNVVGVMVGTLLVAGITLVFWEMRTSYRLRWRLSRNALWEMLRVGFPILLVSLGSVLIETVDRVLILNLLGTASLGYYGVTGLGGGFLYRLLNQAGSAMSPHMAEEMGKSGDSAPAMVKFLIKPTLVFAYIAAALIMALVFALPPIVRLLLPKYVPGLPAFYLFMPGFFFLSIVLTANNILNIVLISLKRQRWVVGIQVIAIAVEVACAVLFIHIGWDIAGVALASTLSYAFYGLTILFLAAKYVIPYKRQRSSFLFNVLTPFVYAVVVSLAIFWIGQQWLSSPLLRAVVQLSLCTIAVIPMVYWLNTRVELAKEMRPLIDSAKRRIQAALPERI